VRLENIAPLRFIEDKRTYIAEEKFQALARHTLLADDVLFSSFVDEEVRVCLLPPELSGKAINKADCFCIRVDSSRCHPRFLALKLASRSTFSALDEVIHGATRPRINLGQLRAIAFHLPSIDEQTEIVQRVDSLFSVATAIESRLTAARAKVDRLTPALLAKAFTGELVPQDSDEEPAANMLARIRDHSESGEADRPKRSLSHGSRTKAKLVADMLTRNNVATTHLTDILKERGALTAEVLWKASQLEIDDFYDQLKDEESKGLLRENRDDTPNSPRLLESAA
jgi:type I restriction enzyme S subunit